jgi:hypothetical protein
VVNYRDHPPQDPTYVYKFHPFTSDVDSVKKYLTGLTGQFIDSCEDTKLIMSIASGGGDGPEAVTAGMAATLTELEWRRDASKMVVLVADAPPHVELMILYVDQADMGIGIGENGDRMLFSLGVFGFG